jgi:hypothetical protein
MPIFPQTLQGSNCWIFSCVLEKANLWSDQNNSKNGAAFSFLNMTKKSMPTEVFVCCPAQVSTKYTFQPAFLFFLPEPGPAAFNFALLCFA